MDKVFCYSCKKHLPLTEFYKQSKAKNGHQHYCKPCAKVMKAWYRYGLSPDQYNELLDNSGGRCAICNEIPKRPCIDHDHATGKVRAILCNYCNVLIAHARENVHILTNAVKYLDKMKR